MTGSSNPTPPSVEMIEAGAEASFRNSDFEGQYAELTELSKAIHRSRAIEIYAAMNAARPNQEATRTVGDGDDRDLATELAEAANFLDARGYFDLRDAVREAADRLTALRPSADDGVLREALLKARHCIALQKRTYAGVDALQIIDAALSANPNNP